MSFLNCLPSMLACLGARVLSVLTFSHACMFGVWHACVLYVLACLYACVLMFLPACVLGMLTCLRADVLGVLGCLCDRVLDVPSCSCSCILAVLTQHLSRLSNQVSTKTRKARQRENTR